jgi:hypothetical protein
VEFVVAGTADEGVVAGAADQRIITLLTVNAIVPYGCPEIVVS